jgi:phosphohistidine phosphatase
MKFYLMRHAQADWGEQMDPTRELTPTGKKQAKMMAKWLARQDIGDAIVLQSNFKRSQDTAKRIGKRLDVEPQTTYKLDPDGSPESAWREIRKRAADAGVQTVVAVSHGPLVENLFAMLINCPSAAKLHFDHAAIAHFDTVRQVTAEKPETQTSAFFHWMVTPNTVARDEDEQDIVTEAALLIAEQALELAGTYEETSSS